jgi:DNA-directed RNA polymerase specialized sigma24 family protein
MFWRLDMEGKTAEEAAQECGVTPWTAYKARARVRARLREILGEYFDDGFSCPSDR